MPRMSLMRAVVRYQMGEGEAPLPSKEEMMHDAEARIEKWMRRMEKIDLSVTSTLVERSIGSMQALEGLLEDIILENPNRALEPQIENICKLVANMRHIHGTCFQALRKIGMEIEEKKRQNKALREQLKLLQRAVKEQKSHSQVNAFFRECSNRAASYGAAE